MPEVAPAASDKTAPASVGRHHAAATTAAHIADCDAAGMHPTASPAMTAPATMAAAATSVRSEYGSRDEQASGDCRD
jgi:hypothetical protein